MFHHKNFTREENLNQVDSKDYKRGENIPLYIYTKPWTCRRVMTMCKLLKLFFFFLDNIREFGDGLGV